jgi:hypothetical protein
MKTSARSTAAADLGLIEIECTRQRRTLAAAFEARWAELRQQFAESARNTVEANCQTACARAMRQASEQIHSQLQEWGVKTLTAQLDAFDGQRERQLQQYMASVDAQIAQARTEALRECELRDAHRRAQREIVVVKQDPTPALPAALAIVKMPKRKTTTTMTRGSDGQIVETVQIEQDA